MSHTDPSPRTDAVSDAPTPLPEAVRSRVVALAARALGDMPSEQLPAALKRVATFAPTRRAKLAGTQIASVLETDDDFRRRLAVQVRVQTGDLAIAVESGTPPAAADPVDLAAVAYLLRPEGWTDLVAAATDVAEAERAAVVERQTADEVDRLRRQLDAAAEELRQVREKNREQVNALKAENTDLRHKLGDARSRLKAAEAEAEETRRQSQDVKGEAASVTSKAEAELRRLRARIEELEREVTSARRTERAAKEAGTLRARLLLDTLLDTAQGLRRELALPAVEGSPADLVEADVAEHGTRKSSGHGSMSSDDPALLEELLGLPRVHLIVDGYNVTKNAWPEIPLDKQRERLLSGLAPLAARSGAETTVVFDAAEKTERPLVNKPRGVRVLFSPVGVIADDVIRQLVEAEPPGRPVVVVSSDQEIVRDVVRAGARSAASAALSRLLARS